MKKLSKEEAWYKDLREYFYNPSDEVLDRASSVLADRAIDRIQSKSPSNRPGERVSNQQL